MGFEQELDAKGERTIWLEAAVDRLAAMRGPGERCSDVILMRRCPVPDAKVPSGSRQLLEKGDHPPLGGLGWAVLAHVYGQHRMRW